MDKLTKTVGALAIFGTLMYGFGVVVRSWSYEARVARMSESPALIEKYETAFPKRQAVYGLDENGDKTIDHIVHAEWTMGLVTVHDYHAEDIPYNTLLNRLTGE